MSDQAKPNGSDSPGLASGPDAQAADRRLSHVIENSPVVTYSACCTGAFELTYVGPNVAAVLGYDARHLVGGAHVWRQLIHPDDRAAWADRVCEVKKGDAFDLEYRVFHPDGGFRWVQDVARVVPVSDQGDCELVGCWLDITRRKEYEDRLLTIRTAVDQVSDSVLITDTQIDKPGPRIIYANHAYVQMSGYELDELIGQSPRIVQGPRSDRAVLDQARAALEAERPFRGEVFNHRKDGTPFLIEWQLAPVKNESGHVINWIAIQRDITQERAKAQLDQLHRDDLAHAARLSTVGEIATDLAHELNQPMAAISTYAQGCVRLLGNPATEISQLREPLALMQQQAQRASDIIKRLRSFVRKRALSSSDVTIRELVDDAMLLVGPSIKEADAQIEIDLAAGLPVVHVDAIQVEQVLVNLIRNAVQAVTACPPDERQVCIEGRLHLDHVIIDVCDSGPGIAPEDREEVFEPFYTTSDKGMGMGLTISRSIMEAHHGSLTVVTNDARQTVLRVSLPVRSRLF